MCKINLLFFLVHKSSQRPAVSLARAAAECSIGPFIIIPHRSAVRARPRRPRRQTVVAGLRVAAIQRRNRQPTPEHHATQRLQPRTGGRGLGLCGDESEMRGVKTRIRYAFHASREVNTPHSSARPPEESSSKYREPGRNRTREEGFLTGLAVVTDGVGRARVAGARRVRRLLQHQARSTAGTLA